MLLKWVIWKAFNFRQLQNLHRNVDYKRRLHDVKFLQTEYDTSTTQGKERQKQYEAL